MINIQITALQLDAIAAHFRTRGRPTVTARAEWLALSEADRQWWRRDVAAALAAANVTVAR